MAHIEVAIVSALSKHAFQFNHYIKKTTYVWIQVVKIIVHTDKVAHIEVAIVSALSKHAFQFNHYTKCSFFVAWMHHSELSYNIF